MGMAAMGWKGGKGLGKGHGKRHRRTDVSTEHITKPAIRRLARRGGVKRLSSDVYPEMRKSSKDYMYVILSQCTTYANHAKRKTINVVDVLYALKNCGTRLMGF